MTELRNSSSLGNSFSSAIFKPSSLRFLFINAVTMRATGSRNVASNIGRSHGSIRRSICRRNIVVSLAQFRNREPVLARGIGRLTFEFTAPPMGARAELRGSRKLQSEINQPFFAQINFAEVSPWRDFANLIADPMRYQRSLGIIKDDALLAIQPARTFIHFGNDRVEAKRQNPVSQNSLCWIEIFSLPRKMIYEIGHVICIS